jgi:hypothetical protein
MARQIIAKNPYHEKLLKLIPTEIIAAYLAILGVIPETYPNTKELLIIVSIILFCFVPVYIILLQKVTKITQIVFTTLSFAVWVFSIGGPFKEYDFYQAFMGSIVLIGWTLLIPLVCRPVAHN